MTYSIVARDRATGEFGIAVQSHFFGVGPVVPWLEAGIGAVATQATVNVSFGPTGLGLLRSGHDAEKVVATLVAADPEREKRQVAVVDARGVAAAHTGAGCIPAFGHVIGDGFSVQGNLLRADAAWQSMATAYEGAADEPFWNRLLITLEAAEANGGDVRGRQSAALVIVAAELAEDPADGRVLDVRVDDHADPLGELRRLATISEAYRLVGELESPSTDQRPMEERYAQARAMAPDAIELVFWRAIELATSGKESAARDELAIAFDADPTWRDALRHVAAAGLVGADPTLVKRLLGE